MSITLFIDFSAYAPKPCKKEAWVCGRELNLEFQRVEERPRNCLSDRANKYTWDRKLWVRKRRTMSITLLLNSLLWAGNYFKERVRTGKRELNFTCQRVFLKIVFFG